LVNKGAFNYTGGTLSPTAVQLLSGGRMNVAAGGNRTLTVASLSIDSASALDLADNDLIVNSGSFTQLQALVFTGFGNTSAGITSTTASGSQILALFDNALVGADSFNGQTISPGAIVGKYTYFGDANFDGQVTGDDYTVVDSNLNTIPPTGLEWLSGDMSLDGMV